jgi:hypothetical protein
MRKEPRNALQNPSIWKEGSSQEIKIRSSALIPKIKMPIVSRIKGVLSSSKTGRTEAFTIPRSKADPTKVLSEPMCIPGTMAEAT